MMKERLLILAESLEGVIAESKKVVERPGVEPWQVAQEAHKLATATGEGLVALMRIAAEIGK